MTFFALIGFEEVVKAVSESRSSADRWIRSIFCIPYKMLKSQKCEYDNYNSYDLGFDGLLAPMTQPGFSERNVEVHPAVENV